MSGQHRGSCQCGEVTFSVEGEFRHFFLCHCSRCRKDTGSAFGANLFAPGGVLTWRTGRDAVRTFQVPGTRHVRSFCATCGAALPSLQMDGALVVVPAGALDDAVDRRPDAHICTASRAGWDDRLEDVASLDGLPG